MKGITIEIGGMGCGHCVAKITRALTRLDGVRIDGVEVGIARLAYDVERVSADQIAAAIAEAGYQPQLMKDLA